MPPARLGAPLRAAFSSICCSSSIQPSNQALRYLRQVNAASKPTIFFTRRALSTSACRHSDMEPSFTAAPPLQLDDLYENVGELKPDQQAILQREMNKLYEAYKAKGMAHDEAAEMIQLELEPNEQMLAEEQAKAEQRKKKLLRRIRIVPASPSYFTGKPSFTDDLLSLQALLRKYQTLPVFPPGQAPRVAWKSLEQYKAMIGAEPVKSARYHRLLEVLKRLNTMNSAIMPDEVKFTLNRYKRDIDPYLNKAKPRLPNEDGISMGVGRRKTSSARAYVVEGEGEVLINGKSLTQFFARIHDRESAVWALKATERMDKYNVFALVRGGGVTGQAEALTLAVAKALLVHEPLLKPALRRAGCVTRDPRKVERKKPGHLKARKKPAWVKR